MSALRIAEHVPLAPLTTLELGGTARFFVEATNEETIVRALAWAEGSGVPAVIVGGGSNLVVSDEGFPGLVVRMGTRGLAFEDEGAKVRLRAQAGEPWDELVAHTVARDLAGLECLSGIPGLAGATPIQNVGAYGVEIAEHLESVRILDRATRSVRTLDRDACQFGYRDSMFKREPGRYVVLEVSFLLTRGGVPALRYPELLRALDAEAETPTLSAVRQTVIALRRRKSMVIDPDDENRRSAGSFFLNPIVTLADADRVTRRAIELGLATSSADVPRYEAGEGYAKLAAGWLIERSGIEKGLRLGAVGVSSRHALSLVHHGGGTTRALLELAQRIERAVKDRFGIDLVREPVFLGSLAE